jgi:hypothetical protein
MEIQEIHYHPNCYDKSILLDHPVTQYWSLIRDGLIYLGVDSDSILFLTDIIRDAGFDNMTTQIFYIPIGIWPKNDILKIVGRC